VSRVSRVRRVPRVPRLPRERREPRLPHVPRAQARRRLVRRPVEQRVKHSYISRFRALHASAAALAEPSPQQRVPRGAPGAMHRLRRRFLPLLLLAVAPPLAAQTLPAVGEVPAAPRAQIGAAAGLATSAMARSDTTRIDPLRPIRLGLTTLPTPVPIELRITRPRFFAPAGFAKWLGERRGASAPFGAAALAAGSAPVPAADPPAAAGAVRGGEPISPPAMPERSALSQYTDLSIRVVGRGELGGAWTRHEPCDPGLYYHCRPTLFPELRPDVQLGVLVGGTVSERVHVDVDYDQRREFDGANNVRVYYQGHAGELLQRVEVGDVTLRLPRSRYLTHGIPAGNFGMLATAQRGPLELSAVYAQQKGAVSTREFRLGGGLAQQALVQEQQLVLDDADYARAQFFFLVHPDSLAGAPHVDALTLRAEAAPSALRPRAGGTIHVYRDERLSATNAEQRAQPGYFLAAAATADATVRHTGLFRRLEPGHDYAVHPSGLWIALRAPLRADESLAVAYVTASGAEVGDPAAESARAGETPRLRLLRGAATSHQPGSATWPHELRQVYRIDALGGVAAESVELVISLGEPAAGRTFVETAGRQVGWLRLFGLDAEAPADRLDRARIWQPSADAFGGDAFTADAAAAIGAGGVSGTFVVLPALEPFASPAGSPAAGLSAEQAAALLGGDANRAIYETVDPVARADAARFRLAFRYRVRIDGIVSTFSLGALGIREGSERLRVGERTLVRGADYEIDYDIGTVTLRDAATLLAHDAGAGIHAQWEQKSLFDIAPTNVYGVNARYDIGGRGEFGLVGLYQAERALGTRPHLGSEPGAMLVGGANARVELGGAWLDRALGGLPFVRAGSASRVELSGELALSSPDPNRRGDTYLDDFEASDELAISPRRHDWRLGSRPDSRLGADAALPLTLDVESAARLVWQHDILVDGSAAGSLLPQRDIDRHISVAGTQLPEPALWLSFGGSGGSGGSGAAGGAGAPANGRAWRAMTTVLATTGRDMTRSEYLEFYVRADSDAPLALVFDLGAVGEDAFWFDEHGNTSGITSDGRRWGLGVLDEEASLAGHEVWGPAADARGLWAETCTAEPLAAYALGDARANCTRGNGMPDSEDLDGNGVLDAEDGALFRYVVELDRVSPYLVRDTVATGTRFRLYRIPLRGGAGTPLNGAGDATWRAIRHLRLTVSGDLAGDAARTLTIARMRVVGARWTKRDEHGVRRGLLADEPGAGEGFTRVRSGPVSRLTDGTAYSPPPGVIEQLHDPSQRFGPGGIEYNEKSLRIAYDDLLPDERAEIYHRYPQQPRSFLSYRQLRLWAVARAGRWGGDDGEQLVVRVGTDARNFYLFRTPLKPATGARAVTDVDWLPEVVIEFEPWLELKARAERALLERAGAGAPADTLWSDDGRYAIVFEDRARAPNLAAVRELGFAVYNAGGATASGELWIDDLRLGGAVRDAGAASHVALDVRGGDVLDMRVAYGSRGALFQQLGQAPTHLGTGELSITARARLDRLLPETWGLDVPLSVAHSRASQAPEFLERSDVRADRLDGLREAGSDATRVALTVRRALPAANPRVGALVDGAALHVGYTTTRASAITARSEADGIDVGVTYRYEPTAHELAIVPPFAAAALRALTPRAIEESDAFARLLDARLRTTPRTLSFGTRWFRHEHRTWRFERILALPGDSLPAPIESPRHGLEHDARLGFAPLEALSAELVVRSHRDLLDARRASPDAAAQAALRDARARLAGVDVGWETNRTMTTSVAYRPRITTWLRPSYTFTSRYGTDRHASFLALVPAGADTGARLQRRFGGDRTTTRALQLEPLGLYDALAGGAPDAGERAGAARRVVAALLPLTAQRSRRLGSSWERETFAPSWSYQLGVALADRYRVMGDDSAASIRARDDVRVASGFRVGGAQLDVSYREATQDGRDRVGGRRTLDERGWPQLRLAWMNVPLPAALARVARSTSLSTGWERSRRATRLDDGGEQRTSDELRLPLQVGVAFGAGVSASYTAVLSGATTSAPSGRGEEHGLAHGVQLGGALRAPRPLATTLPNPVNVQLGWTQQSQTQCRYRNPDGGECVPYLDIATGSLNVGADTRLADLVVGMQMSYTTRRNGVGAVTGTERFQLNLFGQFSFEAGRLPAGGAR
jgi:hypothetical protein